MATHTISKIELPNGDICNIKDTNNTTGTTASNEKLYLAGATSQSANPQTYSNVYVYETAGVLSAKELDINGGSSGEKVKMQWNATDLSLDFIFN